MIGQKNLLKTLNDRADNFPQFIIIAGPKGGGKKLLAGEVARNLNAAFCRVGISIADIRSMIDMAYKVSMPTVFLIPDVDTMSISAKNALLKITEEPPKQAYFVMTVLNINSVLATIKSRATIYYLDPYTVTELNDYAVKLIDEKNKCPDHLDTLLSICETPGEIEMLFNMDTNEFYNYVQKVLMNIGKVSTTNIFKIGEKIALKNEENKYDLILFWKFFAALCIKNYDEYSVKYAYGARITSKYLQDLRINGVNKTFLFDAWLLDMVEEWDKWN